MVLKRTAALPYGIGAREVLCQYPLHDFSLIWSSIHELLVSTRIGETASIAVIYPKCLTSVANHELPIDLIPMGMVDFDVILGTSWVAAYHANSECFRKATFSLFWAFHHLNSMELKLGYVLLRVFSLCTWHLLWSGCQGFLAHVSASTYQEQQVGDILVIRKIFVMFFEDLLGLPPLRDIDFAIGLVPGATSISKASYRMAMVELKELKE